jgi:hypothetical protein
MALNIKDTVLWADIRDIVYSPKKPVRNEYRLMIHTENEDIPALKMIALDEVRDYVNNIGDVNHVTFILPLGEYMVRLYPFRSNLEVTVKRILLTEEGSTKERNSIIYTERYKAVFLVDENQNFTAKELEGVDLDSLNSMNVVEVKLQLLNRSLEPLRIKSVSGIFRNVTQKQIIHNLMAGESAKVKVDGKTSIDNIDIVEPDNKEVKKHVIFPDGSLVVNIPTYLQERMGGVYNSGIGSYLQVYKQKTTWFVYPLFNTNRFKTSKDDKAIIYAVTPGTFQGLERTYKTEADVIHILATNETKYTDAADTDYMNKGSGFKMTDANSFMKKPVEITEQGAIPNRNRLNTEVVAEERKDGLNYAPMISGRSSANPFKEYSKVNSRNVARIDFIWENSNSSLLYPGMPCRYIFLDDDKIVELNGTICFVQNLTELQGIGINGTVYKSKSVVTLLTEQKPLIRKIPKPNNPTVF